LLNYLNSPFKICFMTKAKIVLFAICLLAGLGAAVAFKARVTTGYIKTGPGSNQYAIVQVQEDCTVVGTGCKYTSLNGATYQLYQIGNLNYYYPVRIL
jgi:hypothetical protein